jgi:hypothetical protein
MGYTALYPRTLHNHRCENLNSYKKWYGYGKLTEQIQKDNLKNVTLVSLSLTSQGRETQKYEGCESSSKGQREVRRNSMGNSGPLKALFQG